MLTDTESKPAVTSGGGWNKWVGEWKEQTIGCKIDHEDALYNVGDIANIS